MSEPMIRLLGQCIATWNAISISCKANRVLSQFRALRYSDLKVL